MEDIVWFSVFVCVVIVGISFIRGSVHASRGCLNVSSNRGLSSSAGIDMKKDIEVLIAEERAAIISKYDKVSEWRVINGLVRESREFEMATCRVWVLYGSFSFSINLYVVYVLSCALAGGEVHSFSDASATNPTTTPRGSLWSKTTCVRECVCVGGCCVGVWLCVCVIAWSSDSLWVCLFAWGNGFTIYSGSKKGFWDHKVSWQMVFII